MTGALPAEMADTRPLSSVVTARRVCVGPGSPYRRHRKRGAAAQGDRAAAAQARTSPRSQAVGQRAVADVGQGVAAAMIVLLVSTCDCASRAKLSARRRHRDVIPRAGLAQGPG